MLSKIKSAVIGHAIGDALGVPVEFSERIELSEEPVKTMKGYGTYRVPAGSWSDDTSMSLCALDILAGGKLDYNGIMTNFKKWYYEASFTATGKVFDIGGTCSRAIDNFVNGGLPYDKCGIDAPDSLGNGSLMRILPFALYTASPYFEGDALEVIHTGSALTHAHERCKVACGIYSFVIWQLLRDPIKKSVLIGIEKAKQAYADSAELLHFERIFAESFCDMSENVLRSSGYVVDTLEAALWCLITTDSYSECVLKAVNLGDDTDTVAAIAGSAAGLLYGYDSIPDGWRNTLLKRDYIEDICKKAYTKWYK